MSQNLQNIFDTVDYRKFKAGSDTWSQNMAQGRKNRPCAEETKIKIGDANRGRPNLKLKGVKQTQEHNQKVRATQRKMFDRAIMTPHGATTVWTLREQLIARDGITRERAAKRVSYWLRRKPTEYYLIQVTK